jgi:anti-sigma28 factor (negative regulator of flagellin synthesis)
LSNVSKVWTVFDCDGKLLSSNEDAVRLRFGKTCRVTDRASKGKQRVSQASMFQAHEYATPLSAARIDKVATIRMAILNGCYHVSSADLAQKLMSNMLGRRTVPC